MARPFERVDAGVYRLRGAERSFRQRVMDAVLAAGPGTVASHRVLKGWTVLRFTWADTTRGARP